MDDNRVFAPSNTGNQAHAFLGSIGAKEGNLRAACRVTIQRSATETTFISLDRARSFYTLCDNCVRLYLAAELRAYNSMQPATEADDLGYVAPVDERIEQTQAAAETEQPERTPVPEQHADLSTEDGTVKLGGDTLTRRGHWADVTLAKGRTYSVSMKVHRKTQGPATVFGSRVLADHVIYWSERSDGATGPIRTASADDKPGNIGGRIWSLLVAANIA